VLRDADRQGRRAAYLCFNRALADHMGRIVPPRVPAETFHEYAVQVARGHGVPVDFASSGVFDTVASACIAALEGREADLDLIVLDEVQDLQPEWVEALLSRLRPNGRALLLEDPSQQLYADRDAFDLAGAATVTSNENFRTPRALVRLIDALGLVDAPIEPRSPWDGVEPERITYADERGCLRATEQAVRRYLQRGFALHDIAVISMRGRERSAIRKLDRLGPWSTRRFTGRYDEGGAPLWTEGELLVESVRRFKGQAALAVVFTECDFEALDEMTRRLLFVGLTRARMHLEWVVSERAADAVTRRLGA